MSKHVPHGVETPAGDACPSWACCEPVRDGRAGGVVDPDQAPADGARSQSLVSEPAELVGPCINATVDLGRHKAGTGNRLRRAIVAGRGDLVEVLMETVATVPRHLLFRGDQLTVASVEHDLLLAAGNAGDLGRREVLESQFGPAAGFMLTPLSVAPAVRAFGEFAVRRVRCFGVAADAVDSPRA